ncbi:hypothetical protein Patl1_21142 [Pistacia atlantica]|uniref:Uncharacterized protein n=1 Tax=Pistacia atlantica TaxID=434234 RepID=A0ACC1BHV2_9ROSI|nr:hypothetical protein Patl1_21142 [Pistacia atlantica]
MMRIESWIIITTICATLFQSFLTAKSVPEAHKIINLPGQPHVSFHQYAGHVTIDEKQQKALFYYFVEAETKVASKPLVLWLTGGPGCSSIGSGALMENGPFRPSGDILIRNEYSWNKEANMLYLESPAGVGFSYHANKSSYNSVNDEITARDNLAFLKSWFTIFPEYKKRDFFITGGSYAGHYVPQLAQLILQSNMRFNLKGIAIGNPLLEFNTDFNSRAEYWWSHGLISDSTYEGFTSLCNFSQIFRSQSIQNVPLSPVCSKVATEYSREVTKFIDIYDVTLDVCLPSIVSQSKMLNKLVNLELTLHDKWNIDVCEEEEITKYLNRKDVQVALNAKLIGVSRWNMCSDVINYELQNLEVPTIHLLGMLAKSGIRVLVYSGDQDSVIPLIGTRKLVYELAREVGLKITVPYRPWFEGKTDSWFGHKFTETFYLLPPLEELGMEFHLHSQRGHLSCLRDFYQESRYQKHSFELS